MSTHPVTRDLLPHQFPILIEALHYKTREVVWSTTVEKPASGTRTPVKIPGLAFELGHPVAMRMTFGDGEVIVQEPERVN